MIEKESTIQVISGNVKVQPCYVLDDRLSYDNIELIIKHNPFLKII